jgi:hypothetical protein
MSALPPKADIADARRIGAIVQDAGPGVEANGLEAYRCPADHVERVTCGIGVVVAAIARMID